jgi:hypothetical protein
MISRGACVRDGRSPSDSQALQLPTYQGAVITLAEGKQIDWLPLVTEEVCCFTWLDSGPGGGEPVDADVAQALA